MNPVPLLSVRDLAIALPVRQGGHRPVSGVSFDVNAGEIVGVLGESGCGKSLTLLAILNLLPPGLTVVGGTITLQGRDLLTRANDVRGRSVALIPADAGAALNPVVRVGPQIAEGLAAHGPKRSKASRFASVRESLRRVQLPQPERVAGQYPHELSGGMQQRVAIAMAVQLTPALLLADEPTSALDVTIQAQILDLLLEIRRDSGTSILFVTHDITAAREICDRVVVMYAGRVVEIGPMDDVYNRPVHPYTKALLDSVPPLGGTPPTRLPAIPGRPPAPGEATQGCCYAARCWFRGDKRECCTADPALTSVAVERSAACHYSGVLAQLDAAHGGS